MTRICGQVLFAIISTIYCIYLFVLDVMNAISCIYLLLDISIFMCLDKSYQNRQAELRGREPSVWGPGRARRALLNFSLSLCGFRNLFRFCGSELYVSPKVMSEGYLTV